MEIYGQTTSQHGDKLYRIGPSNLLTSSAEQFRKMNAPRSDWFNAMRDEKPHDELQEKMAAGYTGEKNPDLEERIDALVKDLVDLIERKYLSMNASFRPMDFARKMQFFTLDVISDLAFDKVFRDLRDDDDDNYGYVFVELLRR